MSISNRTLSPRRGDSTWHAPRSKHKQIILFGESLIFFGVIFLLFGIFISDSASARAAADGPSAIEHELTDFALAPPIPEFRVDQTIIKPEIVYKQHQVALESVQQYSHGQYDNVLWIKPH